MRATNLAIITTRSGGAFSFGRQFTRDGIATRIGFVAFFDRSAVALFAIFNNPVAACAEVFQLFWKKIR